MILFHDYPFDWWMARNYQIAHHDRSYTLDQPGLTFYEVPVFGRIVELEIIGTEGYSYAQ
jgi:hypothetical protein